DELRSQASAAFFNAFGANAAPVYRRADGTNNARNARVHVATYQTLGIDSSDSETSFLAEHYPPNYFSHIVVDECHRSAWGKWSEVLTRNPDAIQIGLTATPRQLVVTEGGEGATEDAAITADNIAYFGEPVYEYDMAQGIDDGFLAACEIQRGRVDIDDTGLSIEDVYALGPVDANTGQLLTREDLQDLYDHDDYERRIMLPDRVQAMAEDLFNYLLDTGGPEQKTIIFCARDRHADAVAIAMNNLYANWCDEMGQVPTSTYAFKCTAAEGSDQLTELRGAARHHFVATTVDLLTTGVDVPCVRNVVFFKYVKSPISFYQMVGRGTRLDPQTGKLMFRVYDYTNATRLFGEEFRTRLAAPRKPPEDGPPPNPIRTVTVAGFEVQISDAGRMIVTMVDGKAMPVTVEEYKERVAARLVEHAPTLDAFRARWIEPEERRALLATLPESGQSAILIRSVEDMDEYDLYDVLGEMGYGLAARTRVERAGAFAFKHEAWLASLPPDASKTLRALVGQFVQAGTEGLENPSVWQTPQVRKSGGIKALQSLGEPGAVLMGTKERVFAV
ncbi:MAG: DEAD/DEAH box helicase family protein, partial [Thermomicrobia bacterium]|nr:DEAD/DEAH box helicase family protein [Thermomicrobia bacterium]